MVKETEASQALASEYQNIDKAYEIYSVESDSRADKLQPAWEGIQHDASEQIESLIRIFLKEREAKKDKKQAKIEKKETTAITKMTQSRSIKSLLINF